MAAAQVHGALAEMTAAASGLLVISKMLCLVALLGFLADVSNLSKTVPKLGKLKSSHGSAPSCMADCA